MSKEQMMSVKIFELNDLMLKIKNIDEVLPKTKDNTLNTELKHNFNNNVKRFFELVKEIRKDLVDYTNYEKENNLPTNLAYKRLYKELGNIKV